MLANKPTFILTQAGGLEDVFLLENIYYLLLNKLYSKYAMSYGARVPYGYLNTLWGALIYLLKYITFSFFLITAPSGVKAGAGNVNQSTSSQRSLDQSADHTLIRRSALAANHN